MYLRFCVSLAAAIVAVPGLAAAPARSQVATSGAAAPVEQPKAMTRAEFLAKIQSRFNALDTNHDGVLEESEIAAAQQLDLQKMQAAEQQRMEQEFARLDTNRDGQLSKAEFMAAAPPVRAHETAAQLLGQIDANKDGKVSLSEYEAGPLANFNKLDANHNGVVTPEEIQAARSERPAGRR